MNAQEELYKDRDERIAQLSRCHGFERAVKQAWLYGHHLNPDVDSPGLTWDDVCKLSAGDDVAKKLIASYQWFFQMDLDDSALREHSRLAYADGDVGPATEDVLKIPRCQVPDFLGLEEGNWPTPCRKDVTKSHRGKFPGLSEEETVWVVKHSIRNWNGALADLRMKYVEGNARINATMGPLPGSVLAWSNLANGNCSSVLQQKYDTTVDWSTKSLPVTTTTHEDGHALGFGHIPQDSQATMHPSINSAARSRMGFPNASDLRLAERNGYLVAADPKPEPEDPDKPEPDPPGEGFDIVGGKFDIVWSDGRKAKCRIIETAF